jgi:hypothetical protein
VEGVAHAAIEDPLDLVTAQIASAEAVQDDADRYTTSPASSIRLALPSMAEPGKENGAADPVAQPARPMDDLAAEAERARTPRTPLLALTGVWLAVAATVVAVLAVIALTLYFS